MEKLNVAIADDNERMVDLLSTLVKGDKELELVGQAADGQEIYKIIKEKEPDVVLLDIIMPKMDGITVMEKVNEDPSVRKRRLLLLYRQLVRNGSLKMRFGWGPAIIL